MRTKQYRVELTDLERAALLLVVRRATAPARTVLRAHVLLRADAGALDRDTAAALHTCAATVGRVRRRFAEAAPADRLTRALYDASRANATPMLDPKQQAHLIALACSDAPEGRTYWTMQLLADRLVELQVVPAISDETVRRVLKKTR
jgi:hypothetical protein